MSDGLTDGRAAARAASNARLIIYSYLQAIIDDWNSSDDFFSILTRTVMVAAMYTVPVCQRQTIHNLAVCDDESIDTMAYMR